MDNNILRRIANSVRADKLALTLVIAVLLLITALLFKQIKDLETSAELVSQSLTVDKEINTLFSQYDLMESAEFRSVILKDSVFVDSYLDHKEDSDKTLERLCDLVKDVPGHQANLASIHQLKDSLHTTLTALHGKIRPLEADSTVMVYVQRAASISKNLRNTRIEMLLYNQKLLKDRLAAYRRLTFLTPLTTLLLALFSIIVFTIAFVRLRRQRDQIQSSETLLQNIIQSTDNIMNYYEPIRNPDGTVVDFRISFANACNKDYLDLEPAEIIGKPITEAFPFVLENDELPKMIKSYHDNETIDFERQVTVKGERLWFHSFIKPIDKGILEVVRNNTEEYNAKEDLLALNDQLEIQNFIMSEAKKMAQIGSYIWDMETDTAKISDNFYRILDCGPTEFEPSFEKFRDFVHPDDVKQYDEFGQWLKETHQTREHTYRIITKKGLLKYVRTKGQFIKREGKVVMIGVVQDVTEQVMTENDLIIKNLELKRSNVELESFNQVASHDLQEPLRKIQTFISRIDETEKNKLSEKGKDHLEKIYQVAARMQSLIQNLLAYSRIDSKHEDFETIDLNSILEKIREDYAERLNEAKGEIRWERLPVVQGVGFQLEQLFENLISNALKYRSPEVAPKIRITAEKVQSKELPDDFLKHSKTYHKISVMDNGIGFGNENAQKIFAVFQRLHQKTEYTGTGIGLAICKKIVENHHGYIHASSELGKGSTFTVFLPL